MKSLALPCLAAALIGAGAGLADTRCADLALVLAVDSSSSIDEDEFRMQVLGYAAAFRNPAVQSALEAAGTVDVASVFWSDSAVPPVVTGWTRISAASDALTLADGFIGMQRQSFGDTDLGGGLMAALDLLDAPGQCAARAVINVSGDGRASFMERRMAQPSLPQARQRALKLGVTVNGLAIVDEDASLADYYRSQVIAGPASFVIEARDFRAFGTAIALKLDREIRPQLTAGLDLSDP